MNVGTAVLGAGPAGMTAAWTLARRGVPGTVLEADDTVGGIARTVQFDGYRFDLGGHRFYTKIPAVQRMWEEMLGPDLLTRSRLSRIHFRDRFFNYPLRAEDVLQGLGVIESARCAASYAYWRLRLHRAQPESFEDWVVSRFGRRLYDHFFRSYTEKVWGVPGSEIRAEWAAQRIQDFSLLQAILGVAGLRRNHAPTLIEEFQYPRLGPGQMWEAFADHAEASGIPVLLDHRCIAVGHRDGRVESVTVRTGGEEREHEVDAVLSSIPLAHLIEALSPAAPDEVRAAASRLRYRALCLVALIIDDAEPFPDNWIYLHDPGVQGGRVQNFGAWSADMVKDGMTCLGVEYFCFESDPIWAMSDEEATALAASELERIGLIDRSAVVTGVKVQVPNAYPMYDGSYRDAVATIRSYLEGFGNLATFGRNGLHRYNNQDHSMWTAILATLNVLEGPAHDVWSVNTRGEYLEQLDPDAKLRELELVA